MCAISLLASHNARMDEEQPQHQHKRHKYACGCGYTTDKKALFTKHANSYCAWPRNTRRRTSELPGFELQQQQQQPDSDTEHALSEDVDQLGAQQQPAVPTVQQQAGQEQQVEPPAHDGLQPQPGSPALGSPAPDSPPAADAGAEDSGDAVAPPADPYQQFADDIMSAAAEAGCALDPERVWEFVQDTRAAAGERPMGKAGQHRPLPAACSTAADLHLSAGLHGSLPRMLNGRLAQQSV